MNCNHCIPHRANLRAIAEKHGVEIIPAYGQNPEIDADLRAMPVSRDDAETPTCRCECHAAARIVGKLPRLSVA